MQQGIEIHLKTARVSIAVRALLILIMAAVLTAMPSAAGAQDQPTQAKVDFKADIVPLLARHCLECHGWKATKGKLDLSHKTTAFVGGKEGKAIVPGKAAQSLLWKMVESDEMPEDRQPLSPREKAALKKWIEEGATWTIDTLDRATFAPAVISANWIRRLTVPEYIQTVRSATGVDITEDAQRLLPRDLRADGFSNTAYNLNVDLQHVEAYARLAAIIVPKMDMAKFAQRFTKESKLDEAHLRKLIAAMGTWLLRGPVEEVEIAAYLRVAGAVKAEGGDFKETVSYLVEAMLQSPRFIYRIEKQPGDGKPRAVGAYELASRLSYIIWGGPPDEELLRAASADELKDRAKLAAQVKRMLADPRAVDRSLRFAYEWLDLGRLENLRPNEARFPTWDPQLAADMREETLAYFKHVVWEKREPMWNLLNAQVTFATPRLAEHYGLKEEWIAGSADRTGEASASPRSSKGLLALYTFREAGGNTIRDVSGSGEPLNFTIEDVNAVMWDKAGLVVKASSSIATGTAPRRLIDALKASNAITLEAWVTPADAKQKGPARILSLSDSPNTRNFTLGQEADKFDVRFRTTKTTTNGLPSISTSAKAVETRLMHIAYTRDATGRAKVYIDGEQKSAGNVDGDLSNWDTGFRLMLANEATKDRPWLGTFHRVAIYDRALSQKEIQAQGFGPSRYDLSKVPSRGGLLTQGSVLTIGGDDASMVTRGLFVLHDLLRGHVDAPPPGLDTSPVPTKPGQSHRTIAEQRLANPQCGGCHHAFEPLAFGLERYDGIGAYFEKDKHGNKLREDGQVVIPGVDQPKPYKTAAELMDLLAGSEQVRKTLTWKVAQWAMGRPMREADAPILDRIYDEAARNGGTYESLITALVMSDLVHLTHTEDKR